VAYQSIKTGARVAQWVRSLDLTTHTSLSPIFTSNMCIHIIRSNRVSKPITTLCDVISLSIIKTNWAYICHINKKKKPIEPTSKDWQNWKGQYMYITVTSTEVLCTILCLASCQNFSTIKSAEVVLGKLPTYLWVWMILYILYWIVCMLILENVCYCLEQFCDDVKYYDDVFIIIVSSRGCS
jgi:hypothetical protein